MNESIEILSEQIDDLTAAAVRSHQLISLAQLLVDTSYQLDETKGVDRVLMERLIALSAIVLEKAEALWPIIEVSAQGCVKVYGDLKEHAKAGQSHSVIHARHLIAAKAVRKKPAAAKRAVKHG